MKTKLMLQIKTPTFAYRQMIHITYNISQEAFQHKYRHLTPNTNKIAPFLPSHVPSLLTSNTLYISIHLKSCMKIKPMLKIKNFYFRLQKNGMYDLYYILGSISTQTSTSTYKYKRNRIFFQSSIPLYSSHPISPRSQPMRCHL